jgi:hypothetical protein
MSAGTITTSALAMELGLSPCSVSRKSAEDPKFRDAKVGPGRFSLAKLRAAGVLANPDHLTDADVERIANRVLTKLAQGLAGVVA